MKTQCWLAAIVLMSLTSAGNAADAAAPATVVPLLKKDLTGIPGKEATMITVEHRAPPEG